MENAPTVITKAEVINFEEYAMTADRVVAQVNLIQEVMERTMKEGEHYGAAFPGADKPSLLKPGAEKISTTFRLAPKYHIERHDLPKGHREYEIICELIHVPTGQFVGSGVGSCSTMESKYRYRKAERECPECGAEAIIKGKKEYGGGWVCFKKKGGCGAKWEDGDPIIADQETTRVEYEDPADYYNTVLKMGKKRSHVDAVLTATAASDIFTQDIEDMPAEILGQGKAKKEGADDIPDFTPPPKEEKKGPGRSKKQEGSTKYEMITCDNPESKQYNNEVSEIFCGRTCPHENCAAKKQVQEKLGD